MTSLLSRNARIGKSGIFQALYPPQLHIQFCGDAVLPLPAHSDVGPGQCVPGFSTALPKYDMQESENFPAFPAALALYSHPPLLVWPRAGVHGPILGDRDSPFLDHGCSRTRRAGGGGGPRGHHIPEARRWGCPGGKRFHNPCLCAVTPHVLGYSTSPPSRSASGVCNACWPRLAATGKHCQEKTTPCFCKQARAVPWHSLPGSLNLSRS